MCERASILFFQIQHVVDDCGFNNVFDVSFLDLYFELIPEKTDVLTIRINLERGFVTE